MATNPYCSPADLLVYGCPPGALDSLPSGADVKAIQAASDRMDGYFANHFKLPLLTITQDLVECAAVLATYTLLVARGYNPEAGADPVYANRARAWERWLEHVGKGEARPQVTDSSPNAEPGGPFVDGAGDFVCGPLDSTRGW